MLYGYRGTLLAASIAVSVAVACGDSFVLSTPGGTAASSSANGGGATATTTTAGQGGATMGQGGGATSATTGTGATTCIAQPNPCQQCQLQACEARACACAEGTPCSDYSVCVDNCSADPAAECFDSCLGAHPAGFAPAALLADCGNTHCESECPDEEPLTTCEVCRYEQCSTPLEGCLADQDCRQLLLCVAGCEDGADGCAIDCAARNSDGGSAYTELLDCAKNNCASECTMLDTGT